MKHHWIDEELEFVRRDYKGTNKSAEEIALNLGVTKWAVKGQVQKLGGNRKTLNFNTSLFGYRNC